MRYLHLKLKVLLIALMIIVLIFGSSYVYSQTTKVSDKYGNELLTRSNPITNAVKKIYRVKAPTTRHGVSIKQVSSSNIEELGKSIIKDYEDILGISSDDLKAYRTRQGRNSTWHLGFRQLYNDVPVWNSFVRYTIEGQGIVNTISANIHPDIKLKVYPNISADDAVSAAINVFKEDDTDTVIVKEKPSLFIYPKIKDDSVSYYLTYKTRLHKDRPFKELIYFINAENGDIVQTENAFVHTSNNYGNVQVEYFPEHYYDTPVSFAVLSGVDVEIQKSLLETIESTTTNSSGNYDLDWDAPAGTYYLWGFHSLDLSNSYVSIYDSTSLPGIYISSYFSPGGTIEDDWEWATDETNVYYHINVIHDYITDSPFYFDDMDYQAEASVHCGSAKNSTRTNGTNLWFGTWNGYQDAKSSDVIYHEYTHCIIFHLYEDNWIGTGEFTQSGAMNEGFPDYFACTINDESRAGESVGSETWRDLDNNETTDDFIEQQGPESDPMYRNAMIIAGAVWDMRETGSIGSALADELCFLALARNPVDFAGMLDMILEEDDTDADLSNGTPHIDAILYAFENHKIYPSDPDVPPAAPKNLAVSNSNNHPRLDWDENTEPDLEEYDVWKDDVAGGMGWEKAATITNNYWIDEDIGLDDPAGRIYYKVKAVDDESNISSFSNMVYADGYKLEKPIATIAEIPNAFVIEQNYPNPFNPETKIQFGLPEDSKVKLQIFNLHGQIIATLVDSDLPAGIHTARFDATSYPSGLYFYKIVAGNFSDIKRMLLVK